MADNPGMRRVRMRMPGVLRAALAGLGLILDPLLGLVVISTALARRGRRSAR
jgi:hypothetical protein